LSGTAPDRGFKRSLLGYRRREVDDALGESERALAEARSRLESLEQELAEAAAKLESRERESGWQRKQIDELDRVADRLAEMVVDQRDELHAARAEIAEERRRRLAGSDGGAVAV
jgi:small-conductance mechanosensitive channel